MEAIVSCSQRIMHHGNNKMLVTIKSKRLLGTRGLFPW